MFKKFIAILSLSLAMVGCASVKMADSAADAQAKQFAVKPDVAGIYVYRNENMGAAVKMDVDLDGRPLGQTGAKTYLYTEVQPGPHKLTSKAENTSELTVDAVAGKVYYVWQEVKMGVMSARSKLQLVDEEKGKAGVKQSSRAATQE